ncbi:MAG: CPBP family intramembrane glutamic endopeptidase [Anaerolineae bacterium]
MDRERLTTSDWFERIVLALLFTAIGLLIIVVFSPWHPQLTRVPDYIGRIALCAGLGIAARAVRRSARLARYAAVATGLAILALTVTFDRVFSIYLVDYLGVTDAAISGWTIPKLHEALIVFAVIIVCTRLNGDGLGAIYLQRGRLKLGLTIGLIAFAVGAAGAIPTAGLLFNAPDLTLARVLPWLPWLLIYVLANGALEELMFRGLFLHKLQPFFGAFCANLLIAIVFTLLHQGAFYTSANYVFLALTFPLALIWGYLMQKTDAVWASILFHAGFDIPIMLGIFANL